MKKLAIGDIFEIETGLGFSYGQLTHRHPTHTDVLRIFKEKFKKRPSSFDFVTSGEIELTVLCNVGAGFRTKSLERVVSLPVREDLQPFPKFRSSNRSPQDPENEDWWIWDGEGEIRVGKLTPEQAQYPRKAIFNLAGIKEVIEGKFHPSLL